MSIDVYDLTGAISECQEALDCSCLSSDFQGSLRKVIQGAEDYIELKENPTDVDLIKDTLNELRNEVESAQGTLSDLDDKFGDIYSKLDDCDCAVEDLEG